MNLEEQIKLHKELSLKIEELEQEKKILGNSIMQQMSGASLQVPGYLVKRFSRLSIKLSIDDARALNAVKMEEAVDKDKIKSLYHQGHPVQGVSETHFIQVQKLK